METPNDLIWFTVEDNPQNRKIPKWMRSAAISADGEVYAPAAAAGDETAALLSSQWDGVSVVTSQGHIYLPVSWLRTEYPHQADVFDLIESKVRAHAAGSSQDPR